MVVRNLRLLTSAATTWRRWFPLVLLAALGCRSGTPAESHGEEGHAHGGGGHAHGDEEGPPTIALTHWTDHHELFVEFPAPVAGQTTKFHAHVTALGTGKPAITGAFTASLTSGERVVATGRVAEVLRAGIFTPEFVAPAAGAYRLTMCYENEGAVDVFELGSVKVGAGTPVVPEEQGGGDITFLKESQWKIPFSTEWPKRRPMAGRIELPGVVEAPADELHTVTAPIDGRLVLDANAIAPGVPVRKGGRIGRLVARSAQGDLRELQFALDDVRLLKEQADREVQRAEGLVAQGVGSERTVVDAKNKRDALEARLRFAQERVDQVLGEGTGTATDLRSPAGGLVVELLVENGAAVSSGTPLMRIARGQRRWVRARFVTTDPGSLKGAIPAAIRLPGGELVRLASDAAKMISSAPLVDPVSGVATWIVAMDASQSHALPLGAQVVVIAQVGEAKEVLTIPKKAVVEINTRAYVFVQASGEAFDKRPVVVGRSDEDYAEISSGIAETDRIVTVGGFDVHLASLAGEMESHRH